MERTFKGKSITVLGNVLNVGQKAPDFYAINQSLDIQYLHDFANTIKIISAVPSVDTDVCDMQTRTFYHDFADRSDVTLLTISVDLPFAQARFCAAAGLKNAITLSDHRDLDFGMKYGLVIEPLRLLARAVFVLDQTNTIRYIEYVKEMTNQVDFEAAKAAIQALDKAH